MAATQHSLEAARARGEALELRVKVQISHSKIKDCMRHFRESRDQFMKQLENILERPSNTGPMEALKQVEQQLREDDDDLRAALEELGGLHYDLSSLDFVIFNEEQPRYGTDNYMDRFLNSEIVEPSTNETITVGPAINGDEDQLPPLLEEYFDVLGDLKLAMERLDYDIPAEHAERRQKREQRRDQDETLSISDEEFDLSLSKEWEDLEAKIRLLDNRAEKLRSDCINAGLDPDPTNYARESDDGSIIDNDQSNVQRWLGDQENDSLPLDLGQLGISRPASALRPEPSVDAHAREPAEPNRLSSSPVSSDVQQGSHDMDHFHQQQVSNSEPE